jgi:hypothetical protein
VISYSNPCSEITGELWKEYLVEADWTLISTDFVQFHATVSPEAMTVVRFVTLGLHWIVCLCGVEAERSNLEKSKEKRRDRGDGSDIHTTKQTVAGVHISLPTGSMHTPLYRAMWHIMDVTRFRWEGAALSEVRVPVCVGACYLAMCLLHRVLSGPDPSELSIWRYLQFLVPYHNLFLALISLAMVVGCAIAVYERTVQLGSLEWLVCEYENADSNGALGFWAYLYYLSKYYELLDTILQLIRGKYPPHYFLHAYHHGLVLLMSWMWLEHAPSLRFVGLLFNALVHVVMYYYFYLKSRNIEPWWKSYVTTLQIIQFVTSLLLFCMTLYLHFTLRPCKGMSYLYLNLFFNASLLFGFIGVLGKGKRGGQKRAETAVRSGKSD